MASHLARLGDTDTKQTTGDRNRPMGELVMFLLLMLLLLLQLLRLLLSPPLLLLLLLLMMMPLLLTVHFAGATY